ncbi:MAG TPA: helix-turn-helix domain-containing protein [Burkholderiaceae bacterium]|jgi:transcriptional regulator with XRE-family HTH domain
MILKQLRLSRLLSQEQLAQMSGLSVRTIQRIESGHSPSLESLKCLASVLEVDVATLNQEKFMIDKKSDNWRKLPISLKWWFSANFFSLRPSRSSARNIEIVSHVFGFAFCVLGLVNEPARVGGVIMLSNAYIFRLHTWLGDKYGGWYDGADLDSSPHNPA